MMTLVARRAATLRRRTLAVVLALGLVLGAVLGGLGVTSASADPEVPSSSAILAPDPVDEAPFAEPDHTQDPVPELVPVRDPVPVPAPASPPAAPLNSFSVKVEYVYDGNIVDVQHLGDLPEGFVITASDLMYPAAYQLADPFPDHTVSGNEVITLRLDLIVVPIPDYEITVRYLLDGVAVGEEVLGPLPEQSVVHDSDLTIPAGYVQANPMEPHVVLGNATLDVPVLRDTVPVVDIRVWYHHGDEMVGLQDYPGLPIGAVITEETLVIPHGYLLVGSFADYTVAGAAEFVVQVVPDPDAPKPPLPPVPPTPPVEPGPTEPGPTEPNPDQPAPPPGTAAPVTLLAQTGGAGDGSLLAGVIGLGGLAGGAALLLVRRRRAG